MGHPKLEGGKENSQGIPKEKGNLGWWLCCRLEGKSPVCSSMTSNKSVKSGLHQETYRHPTRMPGCAFSTCLCVLDCITTCCRNISLSYPCSNVGSSEDTRFKPQKCHLVHLYLAAKSKPRWAVFIRVSVITLGHKFTLKLWWLITRTPHALRALGWISWSLYSLST